MYLHIGSDVLLPTEKIIAIFDMDNASSSLRTREFLRRAQDEGRVVSAADDLPKSFVVTQERVYLSQLNAATLLKRAESGVLESLN